LWILAKTHVFRSSEEVAEAEAGKQRLSEEAEEAEEATKKPVVIGFERYEVACQKKWKKRKKDQTPVGRSGRSRRDHQKKAVDIGSNAGRQKLWEISEKCDAPTECRKKLEK